MGQNLLEKQDKILAILREHLGLSDNATVKREPDIENNLNFRPDLIIEDGARLVVVELKDTARFEALSQIFMLKKVLIDNYEKNDVIAVLMARRFSPQLEAIAKQYDVIPINLPRDIKQYDKSPIQLSNGPQKSKITSEKSWRVISSLLKNHFATIRQISQSEQVSYGLAHLVINNLVEQGVVVRKAGYYEIADLRKLLNGIAWERPFEKQKVIVINSSFKTSYSAAKAISKRLRDQGKGFAFTGYTAGSLYTGYAVRHDAVYLYLKDQVSLELIQGQYSEDNEHGVKIFLYTPDRDVFNDVREIESVTVVSPRQALLDLAGLGYSGMDMTNAMVEKYAQLR